LVAAPIEDGNNAGTAAGSKTTAWLQAAVAYIGNGGDVGSLTYKVLHKVGTILREDFQAPAWEGMANAPTDNEVVKGKWVVVGSNEAWEALTFDNFVLANRPQMMNLLNSDFSGFIGSNIVYKSERFPMRIMADGTIPGPQSYEANANAWNYGMTIPNPDYVNAPFEVAFIMGAEPYDMIQVGAPPKAFAGGSMSVEDFNNLSWNGEVQLTKEILIQVAAGQYDTNKYGEFVQLISRSVFGIVPVNRRYVIPIIYRRRRVQTQ
jgi:hypothetical protein